LTGRARWTIQGAHAGLDDGARAAEAELRAWIGAHDESRPFFWFVNLVECHSPYLPPRPYNDLKVIERIRAAEEARRYLHLEAIWRACCGGFDVPEDALGRMRHLYGRSIRYMDDWLARILEALDVAGLLNETFVIVTSDHGENLGEGELISHALSLDDRLIRVPLVLAGPGSHNLWRQGPTSLAELPRLISEVVELEQGPWNDDPVPEGAAVAQLDPPAYVDDPRAHRVVAKWGLGPEALERLTTPMICATDGRFKLARRRDEELL
jgi:membrane-anchored protein YejM (alkaline phosphatase superfamily)